MNVLNEIGIVREVGLIWEKSLIWPQLAQERETKYSIFCQLFINLLPKQMKFPQKYIKDLKIQYSDRKAFLKPRNY